MAQTAAAPWHESGISSVMAMANEMVRRTGSVSEWRMGSKNGAPASAALRSRRALRVAPGQNQDNMAGENQRRRVMAGMKSAT